MIKVRKAAGTNFCNICRYEGYAGELKVISFGFNENQTQSFTLCRRCITLLILELEEEK